MRRMKKALVIFIALVMSLSCLSVIYGAEPATSGTCGTGLTWSLNTVTGMLTISGSGAMTDEQTPWSALKSAIRSVYIPAGVTHIGHWAFSDCTGITHVLYAGTQAQWDAMSIGEDNACLTSAIRHYNATAATLTAVAGCTHTRIHCSVCQKPVAVIATGGSHNYQNGTCTACATPQGWAYTVAVNGDVTITAYTGTATDVQVPATLEQLPVTAIGAEAFRRKQLVHVTIPEGITSIGTSAFYDCVDLETVVLPDSLTALGMNAFFGCESLSGINIPAGITAIEADTFAFCSKLAQIELPENLQTIGEYAFYGCTALTQLALPDGLTAIESGAFSECTALKEIIIPEGVATIGNSVFENCTALTNVVIEEGPQKIEYRTFSGCTALKTVTIPTSVTRFGHSAFTGCTALEKVYYCGTRAQWQQIYFESNNTQLTSTPVEYEVTAALPGDMNGDRVVTDADAVYLYNHIQSPANYPIENEKDINGDGKVTDDDALLLLRHTLFPELYPIN